MPGMLLSILREYGRKVDFVDIGILSGTMRNKRAGTWLDPPMSTAPLPLLIVNDSMIYRQHGFETGKKYIVHDSIETIIWIK